MIEGSKPESYGLAFALWVGVKRIIQCVFLIGGVGAGLAGLSFLLHTHLRPGRSVDRSVCTVCGLETKTSEIYLGGFATGLGRTRVYETNVVAAVLLNQPGIERHGHAWLGIVGGRPGSKCAIGNGQPLLQIVRSPEVAAFLGELVKAGDTKSILHWRDRLLNFQQSLQQSRAAAIAILGSQNGDNDGKNWLLAAEEVFLDLQRTEH